MKYKNVLAYHIFTTHNKAVMTNSLLDGKALTEVTRLPCGLSVGRGHKKSSSDDKFHG
jgi:hypothetical protein